MNGAIIWAEEPAAIDATGGGAMRLTFLSGKDTVAIVMPRIAALMTAASIMRSQPPESGKIVKFPTSKGRKKRRHA